ncbi:MAG: hypothetical protein U0271_27855 [Polyangiaceae bacterium]
MDTFAVSATIEGAPESAVGTARGSAVDAPVDPESGHVVFRWEGILADTVWVEHCVVNCEDQPDDWCWNKGDDEVDGDWDKGQDEAEGIWYAGACSAYSDCTGPKSEFPGGLLDGEIQFGQLPADWFIPVGCSEANPTLVEGETYAVGVEGMDCKNGPDSCELAMGCRFFRMENGVPRMLDKGTR